MKLLFGNNKLIVKEANLTHQNHMCDQKTYDLYPENVRLTGDTLVKAQEMIQVGGNKKQIKMQLTEQTGKPVLMKTLHNLQTKEQNQKHVGTDDQLRNLYDILSAIPNINACFITDDQNELVGNLKDHRFSF